MARSIATTPLVPTEHGIVPQSFLRHVASLITPSSPVPVRRDSTSLSSGSALTMGLGSHSLNVNSLFSHAEKESIQYAAASFATLSLVACLVSLYWFAIMARNFRRTLILLLLVADCFKSLWFVVFPVVSLSVDGVKSTSAFCHAGGFFLQAGIISCDFAILLMSLHMSLQIFNSTSSRFGPDGLYRVRYAVYTVWIVLPCSMAGLAFVNKSGPYLSQGAFCTLPIRPFWYRLALSWIPRYLIVIYVTVTALRIYIRVGAGFTVFARKVESSTGGTTQSRPSTRDHVKRLVMPKTRRGPSTTSQVPFSTQDSTFSCSPSSGNFDAELSKPTPESEAPRELSGHTLHPSSATAGASYHYQDVESTAGTTDGAQLVQINSTTEATQKSRRRAIQRQTRLLFIYPCSYMILMIVPFLQHCFTYSDYYAQRPIYAISILGPCCYSVMGFVDCCIFCWREMPWRNIPGSDGTFLGSFKFWEILSSHAPTTQGPGAVSGEFQRAILQMHQQNQTDSRNVSSATGMVPGSLFSIMPEERPTTSGSGARKFLETIKVKRPPPRRVFSGGTSDRAALAADYAAERLALERAAAVQQIQQLQRSMSVEGRLAPNTGAKDWFDRRESWLDDLEVDDDEDEKKERKMSFAAAHMAVGRIRDLEKEHERMKRDFGAS